VITSQERSKVKYLGNPQSGSQANTTASHNTFGQYYRNRRAPVNPSSPKQTAVRTILTTLAKGWKFLTDGQRNAWKSAAEQYPRTDSLGQQITLSGFQEYIAVNAKRQTFGDGTVNTPPVDPVVEDIGTVTLTATGSLLKLGFSSAFATGSLTKIGIFASPPVSAGVSFTNDLRLIQVSAAAPTSPIDFTAAYAARFGTPTIGDRVIVSAESYNAGFASSGQVASAIQS
jgi:hypothetical protein